MKEWTKIISVFTILLICSVIFPVCISFSSVEPENKFLMLILFVLFFRQTEVRLRAFKHIITSTSHSSKIHCYSGPVLFYRRHIVTLPGSSNRMHVCGEDSRL